MLTWKDNLTPISERFNDIYFSPENGLEETKHVFIGGNDLYNRWKNLNIQNSFVFWNWVLVRDLTFNRLERIFRVQKSV
ncbi:hypothetical protein LEP1GSC170_3594 [Leptospira interrogans serovar Bataviae str. HAI135]|nr:hypothetical protein LEP1GSC170_3594 [Leptospira interrogans serovar Bataviae str. HAI135]